MNTGESMTDIWLAHKAPLRGYIIRHVHDADVVDDILQEVYLKAFANLHTLKSPASITSWLFRIASNTIADYFRSQKPLLALPDELASPELERDCAAELATCIELYIVKLPETYQSALRLSEIDGVSQKEVANQLGISYSAAKSRVQRGREKLRLLYLDCCDIEIGQGGIIGYEPRDTGNKHNND